MLDASPDVPPPIEKSPDWGGRPTRAEVDLDAITANARALKQLVAGVKLMAVVKANGYGHGASVVAEAALEGGADWLGVYTVEEGIVLRQAGITAPVLVFGPFGSGEAADVWRSRLTPTVTSLAAADALQRVAPNGETLPFHLKIDTGLARAGLSTEDAVPFMRALRQFSALWAQGLYTHFASADDLSPEPTRSQLRLFLQTADRLEAAGHSFVLKHAANSAATLCLPEARLDMVRTGISIYGYYPSQQVDKTVAVRPALSLLSAICRVHLVPAGAGVGYGHEFRGRRPTKIALVPVGYGDGLPRAFGLGCGLALVRGRAAPVVGRVSMDQITLDVTDVPGVEVGDPVTLIGAQGDIRQTADDVARQAGTISYEILAGLLPRVPRVYVRAGSVVGTARLAFGLQVRR